MTRLWIASFLLLMWGASVVAQTANAIPRTGFEGPIRRVVVFPIKADRPLGDVADEVWYRVRKELTKNQRFLVATKRFLQQKDMMQARGELSPADAVILGRVLDGQALIVTYLQDHSLSMAAYDGDQGTILWQRKVSLLNSVPIATQIVTAGVSLIDDFLASIPYQGYVIRDPLERSVVMYHGKQAYIKASVAASNVQVGDPVQLIRLWRVNLNPIFGPGGDVEVVAEGTVAQVGKDVITVEITRRRQRTIIRKLDLVQLPKEYQQLRATKALYAAHALSPALIEGELHPLHPASQANDLKPYFLAISFLGGITAFLLLAL